MLTASAGGLLSRRVQGQGEIDGLRTEPTPTGAEIAALRLGYERWNEGDIAGVGALFTEDAEYHNSPEWPGQRVYRGAPAVMAFLREEVAKTIGLSEITIDSTDVFGSQVLFSMHARLSAFESGGEFGRVPVFHLVQMRAGRASRVRVFLTAEEARAAALDGS